MQDRVVIRLLGPNDAGLLTGIEEGLFDNPVDPVQIAMFLRDPAHLMVLALCDGTAIGMVSAIVQRHPDKEPVLFIAEVGVRDEWQRRRVGAALMERMIRAGRERGCRGIWLATEEDNKPARALYRSLGARATAGIVVYDWDGVMDGPDT